MTTVSATKENSTKVNALKKVSNMKWVGNTTHDSIEKCFAAINLESNNSGWYKPVFVKINGLAGFYMINEDGSIFYEARVIKEDEKKFKIEYLTNTGFNEFEKYYNESL